jgi:hypothetical protein
MATEDARARFAAWSPTRPPPWSMPAKTRQGGVAVARSVLLVLLAVAVGLGALDVFAAGHVLPEVARYLRIRRMGRNRVRPWPTRGRPGHR